MPTPPSAPTVESLTVKEGDLEVTVSKSGIKVVQVGPRGGKSGVAEFSNVSAQRMRRLLSIAEEHQAVLAEILERQK